MIAPSTTFDQKVDTGNQAVVLWAVAFHDEPVGGELELWLKKTIIW